MASPFISFRVTGVPQAQAQTKRFAQVSVQELQEATKDRARQTVFRFKEEMGAAYRSQWATGELAKGITFKSRATPDGMEVNFFIAERRELRFVTAMMGGHFRHFPVAPFVIVPKFKKFLLLRFPSGFSRRFIRGSKGQFAGSQPSGGGEDGEGVPGILVKRVIWGKKSGGFHRDVISEVAESEAQFFIGDVTAAVSAAITKTMRRK